jgi:beta-lactamase regulating signal transducer with metallopeptidase domain
MTFALSVIVKTTVLLACASLVTLGLRRASASARHAVWATVLLCALLLPLASILLPQFALPVLPEDGFGGTAVLRSTAGVPPPVAAGSPIRPPSSIPTLETPKESIVLELTQSQMLLLIWAAGAGVVLLRLLVGGLTIRKLARNSVVVNDLAWTNVLDDLKAIFSLKRQVRLRISNQTIPPMTWGIFRPVVLLPGTAAEWTVNRRRLVLAHELAHVKRNDGFLQILLQAVCSIYWFNPFVWHAARRLRIERECACDDQVLKLGADGDDYADHLLQVARTLNPAGGLSLATVAMAHRSQLETRLLAILDNRTRRHVVSRAMSALMLSGVAAITLLGAVIQLTAKPAALVMDLAFALPGLPDDFGTPTDTQPIPVDVRGSIKEFQTEAPIESALLTLSPVQDEGSAASYVGETRSDGTFEVKDVPAGQYRLSLSREGYVGIHSAAEPGRLTVFNGRRPDELRLHMMQGPAISGRIFDEKGRSKASAYVELMRLSFRDGQRTLVASDISMVTDPNGEYRLFGLQPGEYYLRVRPRGGAADFLPVYFPGVTDSNHATPISVLAGADISGIDLSLTRGNLHSVRLKVEIASPVPDSPELSFYITPRRSGGSISAGAVQFNAVGQNTYVSPLLAPGSYEIEVYLRDPDPIRWAHTTVEVENRDVNAGTLVIGPGVWVRGRVTAAESLPVGVRRGQLLVILRPLDGSIFLLPSAQVGNDGSFVIPRVPERRFRVELSGLPPEVYLASARFAGREVLNSGFMMPASTASDLDLSIASSGGVVAGVVRGVKDEPISNGTVVLIPSDKEDISLYRTASTDQFGVFSVTGVPPGEYGVLAWSSSRGKAYLDPVFLRAVENQAAKVVVQRGFTNTINVRAIAP